MITACWNVFMLPINIAFEIESEASLQIDTLVDICFVLDMIIVFRTSIIDEESGEEISDWKIIGTEYLKGRFIVDFLSTVPFDSVALLFVDAETAKNFKLLGIMKLIRVLRLNRIIMYLNVKQDIKASIKLIKLVFFLLMYVHFVGCLWYSVVNVTRYWIPPADYVDGWDSRGSFFKKEPGHQYLMSLYTSCLFLFGGDLGARDDI